MVFEEYSSKGNETVNNVKVKEGKEEGARKEFTV
jgi:hypothetical protein